MDLCKYENVNLMDFVLFRGMKHNVSWSFSNSITDILLETLFPPEQTVCSYPGPDCQNPPRVSFHRSAADADLYLLQCDGQNLSEINDTLCAETLNGSRGGSSSSVLNLCQALSSLSTEQIQTAWSNLCYVLQALTSPFLSKSSDCSNPPGPHRMAREASNLQQLACSYDSWLADQVVDPVLVSLCSDNKREEFVEQVCKNTLLLRKLLSNQMNVWLYGYCVNSSMEAGLLVSEFCIYDQWMAQPAVLVDSHLLELCMSLDGPRLSALICEHTGFFVLLFSNPENMPFMPNCTSLPPPPSFPGSLLLDSCVYSEWRDVIPTDVLTQCIRNDPRGFAENVCANRTFLANLLHNPAHAWIEDHCDTALSFPATQTPQPFDIADWCDYHTWGERQVDDSVVGLCWQHDQLVFQKNVCCKAPVFEKLLQNPQNSWLKSVCTDKELEEIGDLPQVSVLPGSLTWIYVSMSLILCLLTFQVCRYSEWSRPIIVDMTELALCAETDPLNFTSKVCSNETVLHNLLTNQDNSWLVQYCANYSKLGLGEVQGGGQVGFDPSEQCQYSSWSISFPDAALLTLCWEHDQTNFVSSICPSPGLLFQLAAEPSSMWVSTMCATYTNYTTANNVTADLCLAKQLARQFNWTCSADFTAACQPGAGQSAVLHTMVRCWLESVRSRVAHLVSPSVAAVLDQAVSTSVVVLLAFEEVQNTSLHITENIRRSALQSVVRYLERETNSEKKRVLLQCFGVQHISLK